VYPAADLPLHALGAGATVVHVDPMRFEVSRQEFFLQGPATAMQTLLKEAFGKVSFLKD
jgi:NAD-dependent deacetylase